MARHRDRNAQIGLHEYARLADLGDTRSSRGHRAGPGSLWLGSHVQDVEACSGGRLSAYGLRTGRSRDDSDRETR